MINCPEPESVLNGSVRSLLHSSEPRITARVRRQFSPWINTGSSDLTSKRGCPPPIREIASDFVSGCQVLSHRNMRYASLEEFAAHPDKSEALIKWDRMRLRTQYDLSHSDRSRQRDQSS